MIGQVEQPTATVEDFRLIIVEISPAPSVIRRIDISKPRTVIGTGSYGTVVFRGSFEGRTVAVKRTILDFVTLISRDVSALQAAGGHPNVMQYYYHETDYDHLYIASELCPATLANVFDRPDEFRDVVDALALEPKATLRQITAGLHHLHSHNIIHRDVKPQNILMAPADENVAARPGLRWLLSDFGIRKKYEYNRKRLRFPNSRAWIHSHTLGWRAPELIREELEYDDPEAPPEFPAVGGSSGSRAEVPPAVTSWLTKAVDIFALGCLYYYVLTGGRLHAFGDLYLREWNILQNDPKLEGLEELGVEGEEARALIETMLSHEPDARPDTGTCLMHPYFWDDDKRLRFLLDVSEWIGATPQGAVNSASCAAEKGGSEVFPPGRFRRLENPPNENPGGLHKHDGKSVQDLLHALRTTERKCQDLPDNAKALLEIMPEGFMVEFTRQLPQLFLHLYGAVSSCPESALRTYYELDN